MTTWTLSYELHGDTNNSGGYTTFFNILNGVTLPHARSPVDTGHVFGEPLWGSFSCDVTGIFDPSIDNALQVGYAGEGNDYGHLRRLRIAGDNGVVYYGEYPKGVPYTAAQYASGTMDGTTTMQMGDGDFPPQQWDQSIHGYINNPVDPQGNPSTDRGWFYFTVPDNPLIPLSHIPLDGSVKVFCDGVEQRVDVDWQLVAGPPPGIKVLAPMQTRSGDRIDIRYAYSDPATYPVVRAVTL